MHDRSWLTGIAASVSLGATALAQPGPYFNIQELSVEDAMRGAHSFTVVGDESAWRFVGPYDEREEALEDGGYAYRVAALAGGGLEALERDPEDSVFRVWRVAVAEGEKMRGADAVARYFLPDGEGAERDGLVLVGLDDAPGDEPPVWDVYLIEGPFASDADAAGPLEELDFFLYTTAADERSIIVDYETYVTQSAAAAFD